MTKPTRQPKTLPLSRRELDLLGWDECDVIIVTGDAGVDHPAFGSAVIARVLIAAGFRVGLICQPDWRSNRDFEQLGRPRLFFGVTAGNLDSLVANHSPQGRPRRTDDCSPGGAPGRRPDRATTVYCNRLRQAFPGCTLVLGGIEASLRRLAHYDWWTDRVRGSLLPDTRADLLVWGMGERQVVEAARRAAVGESLAEIPGTCALAHDVPAGAVVLPSFETVRDNKPVFARAFRDWFDAGPDTVVAQAHGDRYVVQYPAPRKMTAEELDAVYDLPYPRAAHPSYSEPVPGLEPVRFSITSHRGCFGSCSFCSLRAHQGRVIQSRSQESIVREAERIAQMPGFKGHITDIGGPTVNMYRATCDRMEQGRPCPQRECTWPGPCGQLRIAHEEQLDLLEAVRRVRGVKRVTVGTGLRFDLLEGRAGDRYLEQLCRHHVSGQLRVAPEHVSDRVLKAMRKAGHSTYLRFRERFQAVNRRLGKRQFLVPYWISGHPGATVDDAVELAEFLVREERFGVRQVQQFTPLPMTAATVAWHTGIDPLTGERVRVARDPHEQRLQRSLLQLHDAKNYRFAERALEKMNRPDLVRRIRDLRPLLARHWARRAG